MKFIDLQREYEAMSQFADPAIERVLKSGRYLLGPELEAFEKEFAEYIGVPMAVGVKNCTDAITMIVKELWKPGMPVILPNFGAYPTAVAVLAAGVNPYDLRFVDVDRSMTMDINKLPLWLSHGIIIPVHLFGNNCNMQGITEYARDCHHWIIEDCAQSTGSGTGSVGHFSVFSFYPTKPLGCMGDGGMICANVDGVEEFDSLFRSQRFYGQDGKLSVDRKGGVNSRLDELQSAILRAKLPLTTKMNEVRQDIAARYLKIVKGIDWRPGAVYHQFPILWKDEESKDIAKEFFENRGIPTMIHYPMHVSETLGVGYFGNLRAPDQVGYRVNNRIFSIPCNAWMTPPEIELIEDTLKELKELEEEG